MKLIAIVRDWLFKLGNGTDEEWKALYAEAFDELHPYGKKNIDKDLSDEEKDVYLKRYQDWKAGLPQSRR